jgi:uncharacterized protein (TIGR02246 family)
MSISQEKQAVEALLKSYAEAINSANGTAIPTFYTQSGIFMPEGMNSLSQSDLAKGSTNIFTKVRYLIAFSIQDVAIEGSYAFVQASAVATTIPLGEGEKTTKRSRDFFVLHKEEDNWKIFRYIFNNVKAQ